MRDMGRMEGIDIMDVVRAVNEKAPHFPDGKIDYTDERVVVKFSAVVLVDGKKLFLKRQDSGEWECITGYIDSPGDIERMIADEIREETGLDVLELKLLEPFSYESGNREYFIQPAVATCTGEVRLNWEHSEWKLVDRPVFMKLSDITRRTLERIE